jgi:predicted choloylglycine hydrolase
MNARMAAIDALEGIAWSVSANAICLKDTGRFDIADVGSTLKRIRENLDGVIKDLEDETERQNRISNLEGKDFE